MSQDIYMHIRNKGYDFPCTSRQKYDNKEWVWLIKSVCVVALRFHIIILNFAPHVFEAFDLDKT